MAKKIVYFLVLASDILSSFVTIKGLCHLGLKDNGEAHHYFNKLNVTSDNFLEIMKSLVYHKRSVEVNGKMPPSTKFR
jgi:hypothetical protein